MKEEHQKEEINKEVNNIKDEDNKNINEKENIEKYQETDDNNLKKSKISSYFGDFNNNYYEIKGVSDSGEKNENEEEENKENENEKENTKKRYEKGIKLVRSVTFGIQSENLCVPAQPDEDKEEKEVGCDKHHQFQGPHSLHYKSDKENAPAHFCCFVNWFGKFYRSLYLLL